LCAGVGGSYLPRRPPGYPLLSCSRSGRSGCEGSQAPRPGLAGATANCLEGFNHFPFPSWQLRLENDLREASTISVSVRSTLLAKRGCIHKRNPADTKQQPVPPSPRRGSSTAPHQVPRPGAAPIARHDGQGFQATILCGAWGPSFENGGTDRAPRTADPSARLPVCPLAESDCLQLALLQRVSGASRHLTLSPQRAPTALC